MAHRTGCGEAGRLTVGYYTSLSAGNLRATLMNYSQRFPDIAVNVVEKSRSRLIASLRNGGVDVAIATGETPFPAGLKLFWAQFPEVGNATPGGIFGRRWEGARTPERRHRASHRT